MNAVAFAAKNLYNLGNHAIRQSGLFGDDYILFGQLYRLLKGTEAYRALPRKVSQLVLKQLDHGWRSSYNGPNRRQTSHKRVCHTVRQLPHR